MILERQDGPHARLPTRGCLAVLFAEIRPCAQEIIDCVISQCGMHVMAPNAALHRGQQSSCARAHEPTRA